MRESMVHSVLRQRAGAAGSVRAFRVVLPRLFLVAAALVSACVTPGDAPGGEGGDYGAISKINAALNDGDCSTAITEVEKLYHSSSSTSEIRRLRAAAHGCRTGIGFYEKLGELANADLSSNGPWRAITLLFPSTTGDNKAESSFFAMDALQAWLKPDVVVFDPFRLSFDSYNPGSMRAADLTLDSNIYSVMVSMATIGTLHHRYGNPTILGAPQASLPWSTLARMTVEGCGYASALLTLNDALIEVGSSIDSLSGLASAMTTAAAGFDAACQAGCTACGTTCTTCPSTLRHRSACDRTLPSTVDVEACAAAGIVGNVMNNNLVGWR